MAGKPIHQLFGLVDAILMLICRVKYLFVPLSLFCHSVYPVLATHFIYLCACFYSCAHVFFIMLFHCHAVSTHSIQCGLLEGLAGTKRVHIAALFTPASWIGWKKKKPCEKKSSTTGTEEVHNANSFPNTTDCFHHNEGKQPLLLSSTSTNNALTKPPNPRFVPRQNPLDRLNAPRVGRGEEKFFQLSSPLRRKGKIS